MIRVVRLPLIAGIKQSPRQKNEKDFGSRIGQELEESGAKVMDARIALVA